MLSGKVILKEMDVRLDPNFMADVLEEFICHPVELVLRKRVAVKETTSVLMSVQRSTIEQMNTKPSGFYTEKGTWEAGNYLITYADDVVFYDWFPMTPSSHRALQRSHLDPVLSVLTMAAFSKDLCAFWSLTMKAFNLFF